MQNSVNIIENSGNFTNAIESLFARLVPYFCQEIILLRSLYKHMAQCELLLNGLYINEGHTQHGGSTLSEHVHNRLVVSLC